MKLLTKLTLFSTLSKLLIVVLFVLLVPLLMEGIALRNTNRALTEQRDKVIKEIKDNGVEYYLQGQTDYGSYTMLKDEYISLEPTDSVYSGAKFETSPRMFAEGDISNYRILTYTFRTNGQSYLLEIGKKISTIMQDAKDLQRIAIYVLLLLIFITFFTNYMYTRYILAPLNRIIKTKLHGRKFPFRELPAPVKTTTYDFKYLDESIAQLMDHVSNAFEKEREFTSNASHELMTPISIMQSKIENLASDPNISDAQYLKTEELTRTLNRLKKIISSLLLISRIENEQYVRNDTIRPEVFLKEVADELEHRVEEKRLHLNINLRNGIVLKNLNRDLLFQLFYNLLNNAIRYNKPGGSIDVTDALEENKYTINMNDTGTGISKEQLPEIFNRFKKHNQSQEGYGLGLSIVKSIAAYQHINIEVDSEPGVGTSFRIVFNTVHL